MSSSIDFIEYVCEQIADCGDIRFRKMFGEYMVYVDDKPILLVCDNTVYVKILKEISEIMKDAQKDYPYPQAKLHYILDIDNIEFSTSVINILKQVIPVPKKKKK